MSEGFYLSSPKTRTRKPVERLVAENPIFPPRKIRTSVSGSRSPSPRGRKRTLSDLTGNDPKRTRYNDYVENDYDEDEDDIPVEDRILTLSKDPTKSAKTTIAEAFSASQIEPVTNSSTDSLLRQILGRLELLRQQHKETERQIQYIIDESGSSPDLFILQQAKLSQTETENNASLSGELMHNLRAISNLLQRD